MWPKIEFELDEPVVLHLCFSQGKAIPSKYYERWPGDTIHYVFNAEEGVFFLPDCAGSLLNARLRACNYLAGELLLITRVLVDSPNSVRPVTEYLPEVIEEVMEEVE